MEEYITGTAKSALVLVCLLGLLGCGISVSQESAQQAVANAEVAVDLAKESQADVYSRDNLKRAERFLSEAEDALSHNRKQRAYTLATKAEESATAAAEEARQYLGITELNDLDNYEIQKTDISDNIPPLPAGDEAPLVAPSQEPVDIKPAENPITPPAIPQAVAPGKISEPFVPETAVQESISLVEMQNRIKIALQALEGAESAVQAARSLMLRTQVEIGLSMSEKTIQQVRKTRSSPEIANLLQSWHDQAQKASASGDYEDAIRLLERVQTYAQPLTTPAR